MMNARQNLNINPNNLKIDEAPASRAGRNKGPGGLTDSFVKRRILYRYSKKLHRHQRHAREALSCSLTPSGTRSARETKHSASGLLPPRKVGSSAASASWASAASEAAAESTLTLDMHMFSSRCDHAGAEPPGGVGWGSRGGLVGRAGLLGPSIYIYT